MRALRKLRRDYPTDAYVFVSEHNLGHKNIQHTVKYTDMAPNLAIREDALGPEHPDTATALNNLANLFRDQGDYAEARPNTCADAPRSRSKRRRARISSPRSE